jgi:hypothetical protein
VTTRLADCYGTVGIENLNLKALLQDRDYNAALNILYEALRLVGVIDQVALGTGLDGA